MCKGKEGDNKWVEYGWTNPVSKKIEPKITYGVKYGDTVVISGIYKK